MPHRRPGHVPCAKSDALPVLYWVTLCAACLLHFLQKVFLPGQRGSRAPSEALTHDAAARSGCPASGVSDAHPSERSPAAGRARQLPSARRSRRGWRGLTAAARPAARRDASLAWRSRCSRRAAGAPGRRGAGRGCETARVGGRGGAHHLDALDAGRPPKRSGLERVCRPTGDRLYGRVALALLLSHARPDERGQGVWSPLCPLLESLSDSSPRCPSLPAQRPCAPRPRAWRPVAPTPAAPSRRRAKAQAAEPEHASLTRLDPSSEPRS